ncbi:S8 family peptidase [Orenia marismortui]|uniref:Subtilase family protein n=1 Tax=Orenia marismortui TaxID=46469 RepID=A0A4V3H023_9FIRM|nr:S8 family serine peptidase [Orenia marismortui]TDX59009.1 subtilase family protein [Orenia marismortui]
MHRRRIVLNLLLTLFILVLITGCSGGGDESPKNNKPIIDNVEVSKTDLYFGESINLSASARDVDQEMLTYSWVVNQGEGSITTDIENNSEGKKAIYTAPKVEGTFNIILTVSDSKNTVRKSITINVSKPNTAITSLDMKKLIFENESVDIIANIHPYFKDKIQSYNWTSKEGNINFDANKGQYSAPNQATTDTITLTVTFKEGSVEEIESIENKSQSRDFEVKIEPIVEMFIDNRNLIAGNSTDISLSGITDTVTSVEWSANKGDIIGDRGIATYTSPSVPYLVEINAKINYYNGEFSRTLTDTITVSQEVSLSGKLSFTPPNWLREDACDTGEPSEVNSNNSDTSTQSLNLNKSLTETNKYKENQIFIIFEDYASNSEIIALLNEYNLNILKRSDNLITSVSNVDINEEIVAEQISNENIVANANPISFAKALSEPIYPITNDNYDDYDVDGVLWHHRALGMNYVWEYLEDTLDSLETIKVAVLDTGIDLEHPLLKDRTLVSEGRNWVLESDGSVDRSKFDDDHGHGSAVAGFIGAIADSEDGTGVRGIAPNVELVPLKIINYGGYAGSDDIYLAMNYAKSIGVRVANLSLGDNDFVETASNFFKDLALNHNIISVGAGGNEGFLDDGREKVIYPAGYDYVLGVGNIGLDGERYYTSNYGENLDFVAGGTFVASTWNTDNCYEGRNPDYWLSKYTKDTGTSFSSPIIAGVVSLLLGQHPEYTFDEVYETLKKYSIDLGDEGKDIYYGWGLPNVYRMLTETTIDKATVFLGKKVIDEDTEEITYQRLSQEYPLSEFINGENGEFEFAEIVGGVYKLYAWIDVNEDGIISNGDYLGASEKFATGEVNLDLSVYEED